VIITGAAGGHTKYFPVVAVKKGVKNMSKRWQEILGGPKLPPKDKATLMRRLREDRKAQGLVRLELWIKPGDKTKITDYANSLL
jgi:hypothetical protein